MILADTSVWVDHLRRGDAKLAELLNAGQVLSHRFVIGELALGNLRNRDVVLEALQNLPEASIATDQEVLHFIARHALSGRGIGYVDVHLLVAAQLSHGASLWTRDKCLHAESIRLGLSANLPPPD